jgi:hypothetical protein
MEPLLICEFVNKTRNIDSSNMCQIVENFGKLCVPQMSETLISYSCTFLCIVISRTYSRTFSPENHSGTSCASLIYSSLFSWLYPSREAGLGFPTPEVQLQQFFDSLCAFIGNLHCR